MNIVIIGTGYVGLVTGVGLASLGNTVNFIDLDEIKISSNKETDCILPNQMTKMDTIKTVSYTHLTLPTSDLV